MKSLGTIEVSVAKIKSVESGNIANPKADKKVVAFTCDVNGQNVKLLLKGKTAEVVFDKFLKEGKTKSAVLQTNGISVDKEVYVSFNASIREIRNGKTSAELVCQDPERLQFTFDYLVL